MYDHWITIRIRQGHSIERLLLDGETDDKLIWYLEKMTELGGSGSPVFASEEITRGRKIRTSDELNSVLKEIKSSESFQLGMKWRKQGNSAPEDEIKEVYKGIQVSCLSLVIVTILFWWSWASWDSSRNLAANLDYPGTWLRVVLLIPLFLICSFGALFSSMHKYRSIPRELLANR